MVVPSEFSIGNVNISGAHGFDCLLEYVGVSAKTPDGSLLLF